MTILYSILSTNKYRIDKLPRLDKIKNQRHLALDVTQYNND